LSLFGWIIALKSQAVVTRQWQIVEILGLALREATGNVTIYKIGVPKWECSAKG